MTRPRIAVAAASILALTVSCDPPDEPLVPEVDPPGVIAQGLTATDANGDEIGVALNVDSNWAMIYHEGENAIFRLNLTSGFVTGPEDFIFSPFEGTGFTDYFFAEGACGEEVWRQAANNPDCKPAAVFEAVSLGADLYGWEEGATVWVSGATTAQATPASPVTYDAGEPVCSGALGGDTLLCFDALDAFFVAKETCMDQTTFPDVWFSEDACNAAPEDGYDNTEFYTCLVSKFLGTDVAITCETDANGSPTAVRQFEDTSQTSNPAGCRELHRATADGSGPGVTSGNVQLTYQIGQETCAYGAEQTTAIATSYSTPISLSSD